MVLRRISVEFEINTDSGEVLLDGKRVFFLPDFVDDQSFWSYINLQKEIKSFLTSLLSEEMDTFAEEG